MSLIGRLKRGWNVFLNRDPTYEFRDLGASYSTRPDRQRYSRGNERSIITAIFNRIALDVASLKFQHVQLDEEGRYIGVVESGLNNCFNLEANIDQTGEAFIIDIVSSMFDEGVVAMVPVDTDKDPETGSYDIDTMRTGKITQWMPHHVKIKLYNDRTGIHEEVVFEKSVVGIIENPLYPVVNEPNSILQRLIRKLNLLDAVDEQSSSGKLDLIIQLPYIIKSEARKQQADKRRRDIEDQLSGSKYGIAYIDGTEKVTQLNRSVENNLMKQIEYLMSMLYSQLGITQGILDGSADEKTMTNYQKRIVEPIASAIVNEAKRKFLTKTARTQLKSIAFFSDPFKLVPVDKLAEMSDKLTRNEIVSSNEIRQTIGMKPSKDPRADQLINKNISHPAEETKNIEITEENTKVKEEIQNG